MSRARRRESQARRGRRRRARSTSASSRLEGLPRRLQEPADEHRGGRHYGISVQFAPNLLLYNTKRRSAARRRGRRSTRRRTAARSPFPTTRCSSPTPRSTSRRRDRVSESRDPYELTKAQLTAVVQLLRTQRPLVSAYWATASDEIAARSRPARDARVGLAVPAGDAEEGATRPVAPPSPKEGITGWLDSWMLSIEGEAPELRLPVAELRLDADGAGAAGRLLRRHPGEQEGVPVHGRARAGLVCELPRERARGATTARSALWKTPLADCGDDRGGDVPALRAWVRAWAAGLRPGQRPAGSEPEVAVVEMPQPPVELRLDQGRRRRCCRARSSRTGSARGTAGGSPRRSRTARPRRSRW